MGEGGGRKHSGKKKSQEFGSVKREKNLLEKGGGKRIETGIFSTFY